MEFLQVILYFFDFHASLYGMGKISSLSHFSRYVQNNLGAKPSDFRE